MLSAGKPYLMPSQKAPGGAEEPAGEDGDTEGIGPAKCPTGGFALVYRQDGELVRSIHQLQENDRITTRLADGTVVSEVQQGGGRVSEDTERRSPGWTIS